MIDTPHPSVGRRRRRPGRRLSWSAALALLAAGAVTACGSGATATANPAARDAEGMLVKGFEPSGTLTTEGSKLVPADKSYVPTGATIAGAIVYDSKEVSSPPATWADLLQPQWKGVDAGEDLVTAAVREVFEETGFRCAVEEYVGSIVYEPASDPKPTHYWWMAVVAGAFRPNAEVDMIRWCPFSALGSCLTADLDRRALTRWKHRRQGPC